MTEVIFTKFLRIKRLFVTSLRETVIFRILKFLDFFSLGKSRNSVSKIYCNIYLKQGTRPEGYFLPISLSLSLSLSLAFCGPLIFCQSFEKRRGERGGERERKLCIKSFPDKEILDMF